MGASAGVGVSTGFKAVAAISSQAKAGEKTGKAQAIIEIRGPIAESNSVGFSSEPPNAFSAGAIESYLCDKAPLPTSGGVGASTASAQVAPGANEDKQSSVSKWQLRWAESKGLAR
jgi:hypothetical protein